MEYYGDKSDKQMRQIIKLENGIKKALECLKDSSEHGFMDAPNVAGAIVELDMAIRHPLLREA